jgi:hypothetical protein
MHWSDLLIIYLSCGAPFGVYFFLQSRKRGISTGLLLRAGAATLFWIPFAYLLWRKNVAKRLTKKEFFLPNPEISLLEQQISVLQEQILQAFIELNSKTGQKLHFFAFRDVLERYAGLTLAVKADENSVGESDFEIFRIAGRKKKELPLAGKCLAKRNSMRLISHQSKSCEDFLNHLAKLSRIAASAGPEGKPPNIFAFQGLILELFELIDVKTLQKAESVFINEEDARGHLTDDTENGFYKSEVIPCPPRLEIKPPAQPQLQTSPLRPLQMKQTAK